MTCATYDDPGPQIMFRVFFQTVFYAYIIQKYGIQYPHLLVGFLQIRTIALSATAWSSCQKNSLILTPLLVGYFANVLVFGAPIEYIWKIFSVSTGEQHFRKIFKVYSLLMIAVRSSKAFVQENVFMCLFTANGDQ